MTVYDFDRIIDRRHTGCLKYDFAERRGRPADVLPFWVADMDLPVADEIKSALIKRAEHGIFGYSEADDSYFAALALWYKKYFNWEVKEEWLTKTPGVVFALAMAVQAYTKSGDAVLIERPVYYPFSGVIESNNRRLINVPLKNNGGRYEMDYELIEAKIRQEKVKLMILCSPHNPVGRVWTEEELRKLGDLCLKYGVVVVSDEIHSDFVWDDNKHTVFASLGEKYAANCVVCTSPSKTFNLAGLQISNIFIPDAKLRCAFRAALDGAGYSQCNALGLVAAEAAYAYGGEWLTQAKAYIASNIRFTKEYLKTHLPQIGFTEPEGTYLVWLDFSSLGLGSRAREKWLWEKAKLWLDSGAIFGAEGSDYERINVACPRSLLYKGLEQLRKAVAEL